MNALESLNESQVSVPKIRDFEVQLDLKLSIRISYYYGITEHHILGSY